MLAAVDAPSRRRVPPRISEVGRQPGEDHRDRPEGGPEQHHPVVAEAIREDAKERRQDQLGDVERGMQDADVIAATSGPPCSGSLAR